MNKAQLIQALELDKQGNWDAAHEIVQSYNSSEACWVHAYLHRKEGDLGNANYWYRRSGREMPGFNLATEWETIYNCLTQEL